LDQISSKSVNVSQKSAKRHSTRVNKDSETDNEGPNASQLSSATNNSITVDGLETTPLSTSVKSLRNSTVQKFENSIQSINTTPFNTMSSRKSVNGSLLSTANKSRRLSKNPMLSTVDKSGRGSSIGKLENSFEPINTTPFNSLSKRAANNSKLSTNKKLRRDSSAEKLESSTHSANTTPFAINSLSAKRSANNSLLSTANKSRRLSTISQMSSQSLGTSISSTGATNNTTPHNMSSIESTSLNQMTPIPDYTDVKGVKRLFDNGIVYNVFYHCFIFYINNLI